MVDRYLSPKFGVDPLDGFRENDVYWRTGNGRSRNDSNGCAVSQSRAKNATMFFSKRAFFVSKTMPAIHRNKETNWYGQRVKNRPTIKV